MNSFRRFYYKFAMRYPNLFADSPGSVIIFLEVVRIEFSRRQYIRYFRNFYNYSEPTHEKKNRECIKIIKKSRCVYTSLIYAASYYLLNLADVNINFLLPYFKDTIGTSSQEYIGRLLPLLVELTKRMKGWKEINWSAISPFHTSEHSPLNSKLYIRSFPIFYYTFMVRIPNLFVAFPFITYQVNSRFVSVGM